MSSITWTIQIARRAEKQLEKAPVKSRRLLLAALGEMQQNPFGGDIRRLTSERSAWRRRVGAYRIFFDVDPDLHRVDVLDVARRTSTTYE
jgi:mRNA-degrading endonuclease RelE of RelBE toxin-antitoxin system